MNPEENNNAPLVEATPPTPEVMQDAPVANNAPAPSAPNKDGVGPIVGVAIILVLLIFGGLYVWGTTLNNKSIEMNAEESSMLAPIDDIAAPSDEPAAIENTLDDFDSAVFEAQLDADMKAIEAQF